MTTFNIVNQTNGRWADSQVYWAIIGRDWNTGKFVHVDINGNLVPMSTADNGALTKNGQGYTNYFFTLAQKQLDHDPGDRLRAHPAERRQRRCTSRSSSTATARSATPAPTSRTRPIPNIDVIFDFGEMAILPKGHPAQGIFINTTRVDQFGFPLKLRVQGLNGYDRTVGESLTETRDPLFAEVHRRDAGRVHAAWPRRRTRRTGSWRRRMPRSSRQGQRELPAGVHRPVWAKYRNEDLVFTLENLGTFRGRVTRRPLQLHRRHQNGTLLHQRQAEHLDGASSATAFSTTPAAARPTPARSCRSRRRSARR